MKLRAARRGAPGRRRSARAAALAAACAAGFLVACGGEAELEGPQAVPVTITPVVAMELEERIEATGQLVARDHAEIAAEVAGRVTEILVEEGSSVRAGDAVLSIDPERRNLERDSARARVDEARAQLREQERAYTRVAELRERGVASETQREQAETARTLARSRLAAAEAELGVLERALRDANVAAPFDGFVAQRFVSRGEYVTPGQKLFELVALDPIEVEFHLPEVDSGRVATGQVVDVRVAPFPDESFDGQVTIVAPTIDPRSRTLRVKAQLANPGGRLRPGLFARIDLGVAVREGVPMVLEEAVMRRAEGAIVFRAVDGNRVERVAVETGAHHAGYVEVVKGLALGDQVVSRGGDRLSDGQTVLPRNPDGTLVSPGASDVARAPDES
jgi:membrane fusion protein (multidrug efflux system)